MRGSRFSVRGTGYGVLFLVRSQWRRPVLFSLPSMTTECSGHHFNSFTQSQNVWCPQHSVVMLSFFIIPFFIILFSYLNLQLLRMSIQEPTAVFDLFKSSSFLANNLTSITKSYLHLIFLCFCDTLLGVGQRIEFQGFLRIWNSINNTIWTIKESSHLDTTGIFFSLPILLKKRF